MRTNFILLSPWTWTTGEWTNIILLTVALSSFLWRPSSATECTKKKYYVNIFGVPLNATVQCPMTFQWTVSQYCCYGKYDRFDSDPFCCYSDTYSMVIAVGIICLLLLGSSCVIFICWAYNLPHHILYMLTCGHFNLNVWMRRNMINGPYVDPSFYAAGEPFWSRGASELQPYPLRPMPPRIFYPAAPANIKFRWDSMSASGQMPLFIVASRQFTRNPYSARPSERSVSSILSNSDSRRSSLATLHESNHNKLLPLLDFHVIDEMEAAAELLEALKRIEDKGDKSLAITAIPADIPEESLSYEEQDEMDNERDKPDDRRSFVDRGIQISELETVAEELLKDIEDEYSDDPIPGVHSVVLTIDPDKFTVEPPKIEIYHDLNLTVDFTEESIMQKTRPNTSYSLGDDMPKELQRVDVPYTSPKLPGTIPEVDDQPA